MLRHLALLAVLLSPAAIRAEPLAFCTPLFAGGQAPALLTVRLAERAQALCYRAYAVVTSGITRRAVVGRASHGRRPDGRAPNLTDHPVPSR